ncbi:hypothetical protein INR49_009935 [Caranx melampygus]|nr:hypothetical protein INR49_009935 [Caranx melampygus]
MVTVNCFRETVHSYIILHIIRSVPAHCYIYFSYFLRSTFVTMASVVLVLLSVSLLCLCGSRAQTAVFVKTGEDLHLQLKEADDVPEDFVIVQWKINGSDILVSFLPGKEPTVSDRYRGRVDVSVGHFSVKLKNLQKSDSGLYTARIAELNKDQILPGYLVTVEDPVSPVKLTVDSVTNSKDSCDLTVTCRSLDSRQISISTTVTCNTTTCSQEGGERSKVTASGASLQVYLKNDKIICVHTNLVSWTNDSIMVGPSLCVPPPGKSDRENILLVCLCW